MMNEFAHAAIVAKRITENIKTVVVAHEIEVEAAVMALLCQGHLLVEGMSGAGKTVLAKSLAQSINGSFRRIQCTSDLLPTDITGAYIFDQRSSEFRFHQGPIMANLVLVDEINRAPARTQSALLECMEEQQVTVDGATHPMPQPFMIIGTRNPQFHTGTFALPETELDRFLLRVLMGYPTPGEEATVVERQLSGHPILSLRPVVDLAEVRESQETLRKVHVARPVILYAVSIVDATRNHPCLATGASPRSTLAIVHLARAHALIAGRDFAIPDDVKAVAPYALGHRLVISNLAMERCSEEQVIAEILESIPVPVEAERTVG